MSTTREITDCFKKITPYTPGCDGDNALLEQTLRDCIIEFMEQTQVWTCELDPINVRADVSVYDLDHASYAEIQTIKYVTWNELEQFPVADYVMPSRCEYKFVHTPTSDTADGEKGLEVEIVLKLAEEGELVPDDIFKDWHRAWAFGTIARLLEMPKKTWSDPKQALWFWDRYWEKLSECRVEQNRKNMNRQLQGRSPQPFVVRGRNENGRNPYVWS